MTTFMDAVRLLIIRFSLLNTIKKTNFLIKLKYLSQFSKEKKS